MLLHPSMARSYVYSHLFENFRGLINRFMNPSSYPQGTRLVDGLSIAEECESVFPLQQRQLVVCVE